MGSPTLNIDQKKIYKYADIQKYKCIYEHSLPHMVRQSRENADMVLLLAEQAIARLQ